MGKRISRIYSRQHRARYSDNAAENIYKNKSLLKLFCWMQIFYSFPKLGKSQIFPIPRHIFIPKYKPMFYL